MCRSLQSTQRFPPRGVAVTLACTRESARSAISASTAWRVEIMQSLTPTQRHIISCSRANSQRCKKAEKACSAGVGGWGGMGLPGHGRATECDTRRLATTLPSSNHLRSITLAKLGCPLRAVARARLVSLLPPNSAACNGHNAWVANGWPAPQCPPLHATCILIWCIISDANTGGLRACARNKPHICSGQRRRQERRRMA